MLVYILFFALAAGLAYPLCYQKPSAPKRAVYIAIMFVYLYALSALRFNIGSDYFTYFDLYIKIADVAPGQLFQVDWGETFNVFLEPGFVLVTRACARCNLSLIQYYAVIAAFCLLPAAWVIWRYSPNAPLSVWLYVALFCFSSSMDFIRQNMALSVALLGYPFLMRRGWRNTLLFSAIVLLAMTFHLTVGVLIPICLMARLRFTRKTALLYLCVGLPVFLFSRELLNWFLRELMPSLGMALRFTRYADVDIYMNGMPINMVAYPLLAFAFLLWMRQRLFAARPEEADAHVHVALWSVIFWVFAAHHSILARFYLFPVAYLPLSLPVALECLKSTALPYACSANAWGEVPGEAEEPAKALGDKSSTKPMEAAEPAKTIAADASTLPIQPVTPLESNAPFPQRQKKTPGKAYLLAGGLAAALALAYFFYGALSGTEMRGHVGMYICFPYESWVEWINRLP